MNFLSQSLIRVFALTTAVWASYPEIGVAQTAALPGQIPAIDPLAQAQELATHRLGVNTAVAFARAGNITSAEETLVTLNKARANTDAWHIETAQRLMQTAERLAREARPAAIPALAASALQHLAQADTLAKDVRVRAAAKSFAGLIHERYLGNRAAALSAYQAAVQLSPSPRAKESAARLQQTDDNLRVKHPGGDR